MCTHFAPEVCMSKCSDDEEPSMRHCMQKNPASSFKNAALFSQMFLTWLPKHSWQYACSRALVHITADALGTSASKHMQHSTTSGTTSAAADGKGATTAVTDAGASDTDDATLTLPE